MTISVGQLSYQVKWRKSKDLLDDYIERYNADKPLREQLRHSHKQLAGHLLFLFSTAVAREQAYGAGIAAGTPLPRLRTNNTQLSDMMGCSRRTIINLRKRLSAAGIIISEEFHGSNSQYGLEINPAIVHIQTPKDPTNLIHRFTDQAPPPSPAQQEDYGAKNFSPCENFAPYSNQYYLLDTSKLNKLDGAENSQSPDFQAKQGKSTVDNRLCTVENRGETVNLPRQNVEQATDRVHETGYETARREPDTPPRCGAPPTARRSCPDSSGSLGEDGRRDRSFSEVGQESRKTNHDNTTPPYSPSAVPQAEQSDNRNTVPPAGLAAPADISAGPPASVPETFEEAVRGLPAAIVEKIRLHVQTIWVSALHNLYPDSWLADTEEERARAVLAEYFTYARPERFSAGASEILERIVLVKRWIERGRRQGHKRWVPIPSIYFDFRNEKGFARTKPWYKQHIKAKAEIKRNELLTKAIKAYVKSLEPGAKVGPSETYRRLSQRLGKISKKLLEEFHQQIADINAKNNQTDESKAPRT